MNAQPDHQTGFNALLGHRVAEWGPDHVAIELELGPQHLNFSGTVHGGVLAALCDVAGSLAGLYCPEPGQARYSLTLSLTTSFTGQASSGVIRAVGRKRAGGARIYFSSVEISNDQGEIIALAEAVNRYRSAKD